MKDEVLFPQSIPIVPISFSFWYRFQLVVKDVNEHLSLDVFQMSEVCVPISEPMKKILGYVMFLRKLLTNY